LALTAKTFRLFVSSTFSDLTAERNALQESVFPRLRALCRRHGCRFQAIDLRWGVREEAGLDQQTMKICLGEIERCQRVTPRPNFLILLGDRYGWQPLPSEIPADEFELVSKAMTGNGDADLLHKWYLRDDNAVPPVYGLRPRRIEIAEGEGESERRRAAAEEARTWSELEGRLRRVLGAAVAKLGLPEGQRLKYLASATEQEIEAGAMRVEDAEKHVFAFFRRIEGLPRDGSAGAFVDQGPSDDVAEAARSLERLKARLRSRLKGNVHEYEASWRETGISIDHLATFCEDVWRSLSNVISGEMARLGEVDPLDQEAGAHEAFGLARAEVFFGREDPLRRIAGYLDRPTRISLAVFGASGSGKSALLARAAEGCRRDRPQAVTVTRFIGATPSSSDVRSLLEGLCREISRAYGAGESTVPNEFKELVEELPQRLALASPQRPLIVFLDALDQLSESDNGPSLSWLPATLPENAALVVSTAPSDCWGVLERKTEPGARLKLEPMAACEGDEILEAWLRIAGRTLRPDQRREVLDKFARTGLPLYLKLAFEQARHWRSTTGRVVLDPELPGIIRRLFARLAAESNHGRIMASHGLAYLRAAKNGLSEDEMIDILSRDPEVVEDFRKRSFFTPPLPQLPAVVWSRFYFDLEPYLNERSADGASLLGFFHRQIGEMVEADYLAGEDGTLTHARLAAYFASQPLFSEGDGRKSPNLRRLSELPFQQAGAALWEDLYRTLTDLHVLEARCTYSGTVRTAAGEKGGRVYGGVFELAEDYRRALSVFPVEIGSAKRPRRQGKQTLPGQEAGAAPAPRDMRTTLADWQSFVLARSHVLRRFPAMLFQEAVNEPDASPPSEAAERALAAGRESRPFIRWLNKPRSSARCLTTLSSHQKGVKTCVLSPDGSALVSGSWDGTFRFWNTRTGREEAAYPGELLASSPDGTMAVTQSPDNAVTAWDVPSRRVVQTVRGSWGKVSASSFSPDGRRVLFGTVDGTLARWDVAASREPLLFPGQGRSLAVCAFSPDGSRIFTRTEEGPGKLWDPASGALMAEWPDELVKDVWAFSPDGSFIAVPVGSDALVLCDARSGRLLQTLRHEKYSGLEACAISPDGRLVATADMYGVPRIWDASDGREIATLRPDRQTRANADLSFSVDACAFSPDGSRFVTRSSNGYLVLYDAAGGGVGLTLIPPLEGIGFFAFFLFSPDGAILLACDYRQRGTLSLWEVATGRFLGSLGAHVGEICYCGFSADRSRLVTGSDDGTIKVWTAQGLAGTSRLAGHSDAVSVTEFSPDGARVLSGSKDGTLRLWDSASGLELLTIDIRPIVLAGFTAGMRNRIEYFRDESARIRSSRSPQDFAQLLAGVERGWFSRDGRRVISESANEVRRVWDAETGLEIRSPEGSADESDAAPPDRHALEGCPWQDRLSLERPARRRRIAKSDKPTAADHEVWITEAGREIARFVDIQGEVAAGAVSPVDAGFVVGDLLGSVYILKVENVSPGDRRDGLPSLLK
jgi:WD40 repeat protein